jgi:hypothetical protein
MALELNEPMEANLGFDIGVTDFAVDEVGQLEKAWLPKNPWPNGSRRDPSHRRKSVGLRALSVAG